MKLTAFIQLIQNINEQHTLYYGRTESPLALSKFTITANECYFQVGKKAMSKQKFIKLVKNIHHKAINLYVLEGNKKRSIYGLQIEPDHGRIVLM